MRRRRERLRLQLVALRAPGALHHDRNAIGDDVEEAADDEAEQPRDDEQRQGPDLEDLHAVSARRAALQTTAPILKIGRYIAMTRPPTRTPRIAMISGSSKLDMLSTALSTSSS